MTEQQASRRLILTIDDDHMIGLMLHDVLDREGFDVLSASNGREGIDMVKSRRPELVLLDVMMPEMDGFECLQAMRKMPGMELLPIVMLTGADDTDSINRSFQLGATDFIVKPICWPTLPHQLRYFLRASSALGQLAKSEADLRTAQKIAHLGSWEWNVENDRMQWSEEVFNVLNVTPDTFTGHYQDLYTRLANADSDKLQQAIERCVRNKQSFHLEGQLQHLDGSDGVVLIHGEPIIIDNEVTHIQGTVQDITERRRIEEQIRFLSYYDPLTHLPNRKLFKMILGQAMTYCNLNNVEMSALFISIDQFKRVIETLGPSAGDQVLKTFSDRLIARIQNCAVIPVNTHYDINHEYDINQMLMAKVASNEFAILISNIKDTSDSIKITKSIFQIIEEPFHVEEHEIYLSMSIGIAVYPGDGIDEDNFIKNGKVAMSHAREQGQNGYQFFRKSLNVAAFHKLSMENNLRRAIERDELMLYYHAIINMRENSVIGCEALIRWQHPELGLVPPSQFIPIAEESGLINYISQWVLESSCTQMCQWLKQGLPLQVMSINVSATQFRKDSFADEVQSLLSHLELAPKYLKLELTESILLDGISDVLGTLKKLRAMGVQISIDDFGTGYSSLAYLKKLPITELKIDRSFIRDIHHNEDDRAITTAILGLAKSLGLDVVAEGVDHEDQVVFLLQQGCEIAQGFLFSKPLSPADFTKFVPEFNT
ncbi:MAG: EAL domain-containing protein [Methylovulum sp.]|uniref:putative bifunctional diguanylate cyclase/phosphodiesterase n=1 Tax=Methylovulum sp. TaxID=1916980 RepID=UPI002603AE62|nr:EAL domain-containing protein [Methylovulum sp.]MDD2724272.1 EAL domain-containing protein [Methylovulum sp.]MDD5122995.1 EAL domain-containing protein [Methylovulum sp.]